MGTDSVILRTPQEWANAEGIVILDPDGWDRTDGSFREPCTYEEYAARVPMCTVVDRSWFGKKA